MHEACLRLLAGRGALGFGMEDLAREAGVHKTTVYRRWPSVGALLGEVAADLIGEDVPTPDTGTLAGDLTAVASAIAALIRHPVHGPALTALFTAPADLTEVDAEIRAFWRRRIDLLAPVVERAVDRGEAPAGTSPGRVFEALGAPLYYRALLTREPVDDAAVRHTVAATLTLVEAAALR